MPLLVVASYFIIRGMPVRLAKSVSLPPGPPQPGCSYLFCFLGSQLVSLSKIPPGTNETLYWLSETAAICDGMCVFARCMASARVMLVFAFFTLHSHISQTSVVAYNLA